MNVFPPQSSVEKVIPGPRIPINPPDEPALHKVDAVVPTNVLTSLVRYHSTPIPPSTHLFTHYFFQHLSSHQYPYQMDPNRLQCLLEPLWCDQLFSMSF